MMKYLNVFHPKHYDFYVFGNGLSLWPSIGFVGFVLNAAFWSVNATEKGYAHWDEPFIYLPIAFAAGIFSLLFANTTNNIMRHRAAIFTVIESDIIVNMVTF